MTSPNTCFGFMAENRADSSAVTTPARAPLPSVAATVAAAFFSPRAHALLIANRLLARVQLAHCLLVQLLRQGLVVPLRVALRKR